MTLTLAITTFNRLELLKESFAQVIDDDRIGEILILDDHSEWAIYEKVNELTNLSDKVKVVRQASNRMMQQNKADAVALSKYPWVILLDSDNKIDKSYLDAIPDDLFEDTIYMPSEARPEFLFRQYEGLLFDKANIKQFLNDPPFGALLNCSNYLLNRDEYTRVYKHDPSIDAADTINMAKNWLAAGNSFFVVPGMGYQHKVHSGSGFLKNVNQNMRDAERIKRQIASL